MGSISRRLGTFYDFLKEQKKKKLIEANLNIECEFWDQAIVEVLQELEDECFGCLTWDDIIKFCKEKWYILGRSLPDIEDILLKDHIKDLIFQFHSKSFYANKDFNYGEDNALVHSKGLVIEELAIVILDKVREKTQKQDKVQTNTTIGTLGDVETPKLVQMRPAYTDDNCDDEYLEDLPIGYENKVVMGLEKYTKMIKEAKQQFRLTKQQKLIDQTLKRLEKEAGSLDLDAIAKVVVDKYGIFPEKEGHTMFSKYIKNIVLDYIDKKNLIQTLVKKGEDIYIPVNTANGIYNLFAEMVVDEIIHTLTERNNKEVEDEEVK